MVEKEKAIYKVIIKATIEEVWNELTKTNEVLPFFFNSRLDTNGLLPGGQIRMRTPSGKYTGVIGEVLEFDPPRRYSHTFKFTQLDDPSCTVTYDLKEVDGGVEFKLTADNIPAGTKTEKYMIQGGDFITRTLKSVVETGKVSFSARIFLFICTITEPFTPKRSLSDNWPL